VVRGGWQSAIAGALVLAVTAPLCATAAQEPGRGPAAQGAVGGPTDGLNEAAFLPIGGLEQWVTIRGRRRDNPILMVVGGLGADGPGAVSSPFIAAFAPLEADFTVVQWDMPGAGKTFQHAERKLAPDLAPEQIARDGLALTDLLRHRFGQKKIVLLGLSFGSTIAARLVRDHPERYSAYVAAGQIADPRIVREVAAIAYARAMAQARGDQAALADFDLAGPHPFNDSPRVQAKIDAFMRASSAYRPRIPADQRRDVLTAPHWSILDAMAIRAGMDASEAQFGEAWAKGFDYAGLRGVYRTPVFLIQGDNDYDAPLALSRAWLDRVRAPAKSVTVIPGAGDHALQTDSEVFAKVLHDQVRPWAMRGR
jgi:pimeloyl-ACP methyl ester carboxylesterase